MGKSAKKRRAARKKKKKETAAMSGSAQAGLAEAPPSVDTKTPGLLAHSLRLNRKQRQLADTWTYHCHRGAHYPYPYAYAYPNP